MNPTGLRFDPFTASYDDHLKDPLRSKFSAGRSDYYHARKRDIILDYCRRAHLATAGLAYLDLGCGQGDLISILRGDFASVSGCDPAPGMIASGGERFNGAEIRLQENPEVVPFPDASFDLATAACVFHHVPVHSRQSLVNEVHRILKPGGVFAMIEHNPYNPVTRKIVSRAPIDADAVLLKPAEACRLLRQGQFAIADRRFFLYLPRRVHAKAPMVESALDKTPFGGQYVVFGRRD